VAHHPHSSLVSSISVEALNATKRSLQSGCTRLACNLYIDRADVLNIRLLALHLKMVVEQISPRDATAWDPFVSHPRRSFVFDTCNVHVYT
jgi:hypothetical protein